MTRTNLARNAAARRVTWVDSPAPSPPSKTTKIPVGTKCSVLNTVKRRPSLPYVQ